MIRSENPTDRCDAKRKSAAQSVNEKNTHRGDVEVVVCCVAAVLMNGFHGEELIF